MARHLRNGVLVDTSLLLMLCVGLYDPEQIGRFKRTRQEFGVGDFYFFLDFVGQFERLITTPHILTETSNFLGQLTGEAKAGCRAVFAEAVMAAVTTREHRPTAKHLATDAGLVPFGITDTSIIKVAAEPYLVVTTEYPLTGYLQSKNLDVLNYGYIRPLD